MVTGAPPIIEVMSSVNGSVKQVSSVGQSRSSVATNMRTTVSSTAILAASASVTVAMTAPRYPDGRVGRGSGPGDHPNYGLEVVAETHLRVQRAGRRIVAHHVQEWRLA